MKTDALPLWLRRARRFFAGSDAPAVASGWFLAQGARFSVAQGLIRGFYAFGLFQAVLLLPHLPSYGYAAPSVSMLLWPVAWMGWVGFDLGVPLLGCLFVGGTLLAAFAPGWRPARVLAFAGWLEYVALNNSTVKIGHSQHLLVIVSFLLIFLPAGWTRLAHGAPRLLRQRTLNVFWFCQAAVMLTYSMAGVGKIGGAIYQIARGQAHALLPQALALHVAERLEQTDSVGLLGGWLIEHPWLGWPLMQGTLYLQFFAFWIVFRPALQRLWAAGLIGFHVASFLTMTISFPQNCFLLALFFFNSPFAPDNVAAEADWRRLLKHLPLFGLLARRLLPRLPAGQPTRLELTAP